ncbi:hypothetical protein [Halosimplex marinum]|uniref:hypothetical protein n=1 Tax=Halosimplex marinum TaxID=3396620 RepID=UPI003F55C99C
MRARARAVAGRVVDFVAASERRRAAVVVGVPLLVWLAVELGANLGLVPLALAAVLAAFLYTRETPRRTLAAGTYGAGLSLAGVGLFEIARSVAGGTTASPTELVAGASPWLLSGVALIALGVWFYGAGR